MKILIIWETTNGTSTYLIDEENEDLIKCIKGASGQFVNYTDNEAYALWLDAYLSDKQNNIILPEDVVKLVPEELNLIVHAGFLRFSRS